MYGITTGEVERSAIEDQKIQEFEARIGRGEKIEPGDWMPDEYRRQLSTLTAKSSVCYRRAPGSRVLPACAAR
jgi:hypothetical protein